MRLLCLSPGTRLFFVSCIRASAAIGLFPLVALRMGLHPHPQKPSEARVPVGCDNRAQHPGVLFGYVVVTAILYILNREFLAGEHLFPQIQEYGGPVPHARTLSRPQHLHKSRSDKEHWRRAATTRTVPGQTRRPRAKILA